MDIAVVAIESIRPGLFSMFSPNVLQYRRVEVSAPIGSFFIFLLLRAPAVDCPLTHAQPIHLRQDEIAPLWRRGKSS